MKTKIFIALLCCLNFYMHAQTLDWAPVGAKWYYEYYVAIDVGGYVVFKVEKDTIMNNISCRKIIIDTSTPYYNNYYYYYKVVLPYVCSNCPPYALTFSRNDSIFFYSWNCNSFECVAVNNSTTGAVWQFKDPLNNCSLQSINIGNIDSMYWQSFKIRKIAMSGGYQYYYSNIGCNIGLAPFTFNIMQCCPSIGTLRCYYHPVYGWFKLDTLPCDRPVLVEEINNNNMFFVTVNPNNELIIKSQNKTLYPVYVSIIGIDGRMLYETTLENESPQLINVLLRQGIYIVQIIDKNKNLYTKKLYIIE